MVDNGISKKLGDSSIVFEDLPASIVDLITTN
jgi:hypothetical protein